MSEPIEWTTGRGSTCQLFCHGFPGEPPEMRFDLHRVSAQREEVCVANLTVDAARRLRDRLDAWLDPVEPAPAASPRLDEGAGAGHATDGSAPPGPSVAHVDGEAQ